MKGEDVRRLQASAAQRADNRTMAEAMQRGGALVEVEGPVGDLHAGTSRSTEGQHGSSASSSEVRVLSARAVEVAEGTAVDLRLVLAKRKHESSGDRRGA